MQTCESELKRFIRLPNAGLTIAVMVFAAIGIVWNVVLAILTGIDTVYDATVVITTAYVRHFIEEALDKMQHVSCFLDCAVCAWGDFRYDFLRPRTAPAPGVIRRVWPLCCCPLCTCRVRRCRRDSTRGWRIFATVAFSPLRRRTPQPRFKSHRVILSLGWGFTRHRSMPR